MRAIVNSTRYLEGHPRGSVWKMIWLCPKNYNLPQSSCKTIELHLNNNRDVAFAHIFPFKLYTISIRQYMGVW